MAIRIGKESSNNGIKIIGAFLTHPCFWGSQPLLGSSEPNCVEDPAKSIPRLVWDLVYPCAPGGADSPMINPEAPGACGGRMLVSVAEKDLLRERGRRYPEEVRRSGWKGEVELLQVEGEDHAFQILFGESENAKRLITRLADFLMIN